MYIKDYTDPGKEKKPGTICIRGLCSIFSCIVLLISGCTHSSSREETRHWAWLPGSIRDTLVFAPGIISDTARHEQSISFSPDGNTAYFSVVAGKKSGRNFWVIMQSHYTSGKWQLPDTCSFSGEFSDFGPFLSPDGNTLYFSSRRPVHKADTAAKGEYDIWLVTKENAQWSNPIRLSDGINTNMEEYSVAAGYHNLYVCARRNDSLDRSDLFIVPRKEELNLFSSMRNLGSPPNNEFWEGQPYVNARETFIMFSHGGEGEDANEDIYISYKKDKNWKVPKKLNGLVNTAANEFMHYVTPDGRYIFFGRNKNILMADLTKATQ